MALACFYDTARHWAGVRRCVAHLERIIVWMFSFHVARMPLRRGDIDERQRYPYRIASDAHGNLYVGVNPIRYASRRPDGKILGGHVNGWQRRRLPEVKAGIAMLVQARERECGTRVYRVDSCN